MKHLAVLALLWIGVPLVSVYVSVFLGLVIILGVVVCYALAGVSLRLERNR